MDATNGTFFERIKASILGNQPEAAPEQQIEVDPHQRVLIRIGAVEYFDSNADGAIDAMRTDEDERRVRVEWNAANSDVFGSPLKLGFDKSVTDGDPQLLTDIIEGREDPASIIDKTERLYEEVVAERKTETEEPDDSGELAVVHDLTAIRADIDRAQRKNSSIGHNDDVLDQLPA